MGEIVSGLLVLGLIIAIPCVIIILAGKATKRIF